MSIQMFKYFFKVSVFKYLVFALFIHKFLCINFMKLTCLGSCLHHQSFEKRNAINVWEGVQKTRVNKEPWKYICLTPT